MLARGGTAADAAVAAGAAMAVTSPHMCGLGGDLFAVVVAPGEATAALNASGRAGSGADPAQLRAEGFAQMPFRDDVRSITVPGCVDGLVALHARFGRLALADVLAPGDPSGARGLPRVADARGGFPRALAPDPRDRLRRPRRAGARTAPRGLPGWGRPWRPSPPVAALPSTRPSRDARCARSARACSATRICGTVQAEWVTPLTLEAFGRRLWTIPPNSQGYLALAGAWIADRVGVPEDPGDDGWAFVLVEAARQAAHDRIAVLHDRADGAALLSPERLGPRAEAVRSRASRGLADVYSDGDTTYLCAVDGDRAGVSLIMSNAAGFGSHLMLDEQGIFLHNRGMGFSLQQGHPAEFGPGRRPPHTLSPVAVTDDDGALDAVIGTMGGDAQPQILLQLLARMLVAGEDAGTVLSAPRWELTREASTGFDVWESAEPPIVAIEHDAPAAWQEGLNRRGYRVWRGGPADGGFGHAHVIRVTADDMLMRRRRPSHARRRLRGAVSGSAR